MIRIGWAINFIGCPLIGIGRAMNFIGCPLIGIGCLMNFRVLPGSNGEKPAPGGQRLLLTWPGHLRFCLDHPAVFEEIPF
jgi:hypothetical protein